MRLAGTADGGDSAEVLAALVGLSAPQARAAFDSIAGAARAASWQSSVLNQRAVNQNVVSRLGLIDSANALAAGTGLASRPLQIAYDENLRSDAAAAYTQALPRPGTPGDPENSRGGFWVRGYGGGGRLDGDAGTAGADIRYGGALAGIDRKLSDSVSLGLFGGYAEPRYDQDGASGSTHSESYQAGTYGRFQEGAWHVDGTASYARQNSDTSRLVTVGPLNRLATGSFDGSSWAAHVEAGYSFGTGASLQPMASLSWLRQTQDAYDERGAGALNLRVPDQHAESLRSMVGARALRAFQSGGSQWTLEGHAAWAHEFRDPVAVTAALAGDPTAAIFTAAGPGLPRDSAVIGVGIAAEIKHNLRFYADLNTEFNGRERSYALGAGLRYGW
jgi:outer membrane autotransporter protein